MIRFILLSILFTIILRKLGSLYLYLRRVFGGEKQKEIHQHNNSVRKDPQPQKRKKVFTKNDGEYVDFEEIN
ncbi:MAG: DUF4834 family protein [Bacteroidaceae bacterium]|nr:DUF4834 family protein [Bacteroidaceae bacterium]